MKDQSQGQSFGRPKEMVKHPGPSNSQKQLSRGLKSQGDGEVLLLETSKSIGMAVGLPDRRESGISTLTVSLPILDANSVISQTVQKPDSGEPR